MFNFTMLHISEYGKKYTWAPIMKLEVQGHK